nr:oleosin-B6-like [Aegilops tauschii subsp. strangulata]
MARHAPPSLVQLLARTPRTRARAGERRAAPLHALAGAAASRPHPPRACPASCSPAPAPARPRAPAARHAPVLPPSPRAQAHELQVGATRPRPRLRLLRHATASSARLLASSSSCHERAAAGQQAPRQQLRPGVAALVNSPRSSSSGLARARGEPSGCGRASAELVRPRGIR